MNIEEIEQLIDLVKRKGVGEVEVREGEQTIRVKQHCNQSSENNVLANVSGASVASSAPVVDNPQVVAVEEHKRVVKSPMVGTFYIAASPSAKPFIEIGQQVEAGHVLCIVEAMKMFNQIESDYSGRVVERLVENGQPVEFGQPLFAIE